MNKITNKAIAIFNNENVKGTVTFYEIAHLEGLNVYFDLYDLPKNNVSAVHIHEHGDTSDGCISLGGHFNPTNKEHGSIFIDIYNSHAGDMINNLKSDYLGQFYYSYNDPRIKISGDISQSIVGRSVVIHEGVDDLGMGNNKESKITGNAGPRMACAIIGLSNFE
tara:strand:- start:1322 stop:1816 length:495 start_codon:yes stop_codon:yes gene_type:complete